MDTKLFFFGCLAIALAISLVSCQGKTDTIEETKEPEVSREEYDKVVNSLLTIDEVAAAEREKARKEAKESEYSLLLFRR